ncbi:hypothetical protein [Anaeromyxobacter paludicola]|uniref:Lipoprotein n=1 Tax=Anaeromyxobacter paludicola TaxID=2918171 RepID=A0ABN6N6V6_9BACT|nr:hypothetical protein [Anaeromyxobacter paludicola]BDG07657.1 hypothetical protein AMPC_07700 [Anaeromyxobacter paludicola]
MTGPARVALAAALTGLAAATLAGCPLPQPLAEVSRVDGGTITPPRVLAETALPADTQIRVRKDCPSSPRFTVQASVVDENVVEQVEARWFLDYDAGSSAGAALLRPSDVLAPPDPNETSTLTVRALPPLTVVLPPYDAASPAHVLEVVVSNGFYQSGQEPPGVPPNRSAQPGYEAQVFRWVFGYVDAGGTCAYP